MSPLAIIGVFSAAALVTGFALAGGIGGHVEWLLEERRRRQHAAGRRGTLGRSA